MHLPPQAYTKETLIQAYNWLRSQPSHVQELAKSPDALVALYSRAQIHGENYLSRTNLQGFKTELKNLANMMGELEDSPMSSKPQTSSKSGGSNHGPSSSLANSATVSSSAPVSIHPQNMSPGPSPAMPAAMTGMTPILNEPNLPLFNAAATVPQVPDLRSVIDARSWTMIQEVKNHFNLSSETEAIRLLVAMGYQKMRSQF